MNKKEFIAVLAVETSHTPEQCAVVNEIMERHFILSDKNRNTVVDEISASLSLDKSEAETLYDTAKQILKHSVKEKLKHPLQSLD